MEENNENNEKEGTGRPCRSAALISQAISEAQQEYEAIEPPPLPPIAKKKLSKRIQNILPELAELQDLSIQRCIESNSSPHVPQGCIGENLSKIPPSNILHQQMLPSDNPASHRIETSLNHLIQGMKRDYMVFMERVKSNQYSGRIKREIAVELDRKRILTNRKLTLENQINKLSNEGLDILKQGMLLLEMEAETPREFISKAKQIVSKHTKLERKTRHLEEEIAELEGEQPQLCRLKEQQLLAELGPEASHELSGDIRELVRKQINFITKEDEAMNQQQDKENQKQDKKNPQPLQKQHNKENQQEQDKKAQQSKLKLSPGNNNTKDTACKELQQQPPPLNHQQQKALGQQPQQQPESDFEQHQHQLKIQEENEQKWQQQIHSNVDSVSYQQQPHLQKPKETHSTRPEYQHGQKHQLQQQPYQDFQPSFQGTDDAMLRMCQIIEESVREPDHRLLKGSATLTPLRVSTETLSQPIQTKPKDYMQVMNLSILPEPHKPDSLRSGPISGGSHKSTLSTRSTSSGTSGRSGDRFTPSPTVRPSSRIRETWITCKSSADVPKATGFNTSCDVTKVSSDVTKVSSDVMNPPRNGSVPELRPASTGSKRSLNTPEFTEMVMEPTPVKYTRRDYSALEYSETAVKHPHQDFHPMEFTEIIGQAKTREVESGSESHSQNTPPRRKVQHINPFYISPPNQHRHSEYSTVEQNESNQLNHQPSSLPAQYTRTYHHHQKPVERLHHYEHRGHYGQHDHNPVEHRGQYGQPSQKLGERHGQYGQPSHKPIERHEQYGQQSHKPAERHGQYGQPSHKPAERHEQYAERHCNPIDRQQEQFDLQQMSQFQSQPGREDVSLGFDRLVALAAEVDRRSETSFWDQASPTTQSTESCESRPEILTETWNNRTTSSTKPWNNRTTSVAETEPWSCKTIVQSNNEVDLGSNTSEEILADRHFKKRYKLQFKIQAQQADRRCEGEDKVVDF